MIVTGDLASALAVFAGVETAVLALTAFPLNENRRIHGVLIIVALVALVALSLVGAG
jgi:hypothetical protein